LTNDIATILEGWKYDGSSISARWIKGTDGHPKVQLRVDLGLLQMEIKGRPDGTQPYGKVSLLEYYLVGEEKDQELGVGLVLGEEDCSRLQQEALQYYYRYLAFYALNYLEGVIEDTQHNLDLIELVTGSIEDEDIVWQFVQFFPYVKMMNARARGEQLLKNEEFDHALDTVQEALEAIQAFHSEYGDLGDEGDIYEVEVLKELQTQVQNKRPKTWEERLNEELSQAIGREDYERAAELRDVLRRVDPTAAKQLAPRKKRQI